MAEWGFTILTLLCNMGILLYREEKYNPIRNLIIAIATFWSGYAVLSGVYFLFDKFSIVTVLVCQCTISFLILLLLIIKLGVKKIQVDIEIARELPIVLILFFALILSFSKFELFHTGQDQGLYQAEALELYMGHYEVEHDFEEYNIFQNEEDKQKYKDMLDKTWPGYYLMSTSAETAHMQSKSDVSGVYHGVQTFPAMLALAGRLFDMKNMFQLQTIFYLCGIAFLYYTLYDMNTRKKNRLLLTLIFALSPLILWLSKASYTEMFLTMTMSFYLYLVFDKNKFKWIMLVPLLAFSFVHVSFLIFWPCFWLVNFVLYCSERNKQYIGVNICSSIGMVAGYYVMAHIATRYFYGNCSRLYVSDIVTQENLLIWIALVVILSCIVSIITLIIDIEKIAHKIVGVKRFIWVIPFILILAMIFWIRLGLKEGYILSPEDASIPSIYLYYGQGKVAFGHLSIFACAMATGFIILPYTFICMIRNPQKTITNPPIFAVTILFLYIVVLLSVFFRNNIPYYYYYSRYLAYYIPIICLMGAVYLEECKMALFVPIAVLSLCSMIPFDQAIVLNKDDTIWEWEVLEDLDNALDEGASVIIVGEELQRDMGPYVRTVANVSVFPNFEDRDRQVEILGNSYDNIYVLSTNECEQGMYGKYQLNIVYRDSYIHSQGRDFVKGFFPTSVDTQKKEIILYHCEYK